MPVTTLWPGLDRLGLQLGQRLDLAEAGAHLAGVDLRHLDRVEPGLDERPRHLLGERLGALVGPDEVVADGRGDRVLQLGTDLRPVLVGSQSSMTFSVCWVIARNRPRRSWSTSAVRSAMPSLSTCCHSAVCCSASWASSLRRSSSAFSRSRASGSLSADSSESTVKRQMLCGRTDLGEHLIADPVVLPGQHLLAEELDDGGEVGLLVEFLVVELDARGCAAATRPGSSGATGPRAAGGPGWPRRSRASAGRDRSWSRRSLRPGRFRVPAG